MNKHVLVTMAAVTGLVALGAPAARAQSEIDPDHFELSNVEPFDKAPNRATSEAKAVHFEGKVRLAYIAQGNNTNLRADKAVSRTVNQDGKAVVVGRVPKKARGRRTAATGSVIRQKLGTGSAAPPALAS